MTSIKNITVLVGIMCLLGGSTTQGETSTEYDKIWKILDSGLYSRAMELLGSEVRSDSNNIGLVQLEVRAGILGPESQDYVTKSLQDVSASSLAQWRRALILWEMGHCRQMLQFARGEYERTGSGWAQLWVARALRDLDGEAEAEKLYGTLADSAAVQEFALTDLADMYAKQRKFDRSDSVIRILATMPGNESACESRIAWNRACRGDWPGALEAVRKLSKQTQSAYDAVTETWYLTRLGRNDEALAVAREALVRFPKNKRVMGVIVETAERLGLMAVADEYLSQMTPYQQAYLGLSNLIDRAYELGDTLAYDTLARGWLQVCLDEVYVAGSYVTWLRKRNRSSEAQAVLDAFHREASSEKDIWLRVNVVSEDAPRVALDTLLAHFSSKNTTMWLDYTLVGLTFRSGLADSADVIINERLQHHPGNIGLMIDALHRDIPNRRFDQIEQYLTFLTRAGYDPVAIESYKLRARMYRGETGDAERQLDSLLKKWPAHPAVAWEVGLLYGEDDRREKLRSTVHDYLAAPGKTIWLNRYLSMLLCKIGETSIADSLVSHLLTAYPNAADLYYMRGSVRQQAGDYQASAVDYERAKALDPFNPDYDQASVGSAQKGVSLDQAETSAAMDTTAIPQLSIDSLRALANSVATGSSDEYVVLVNHEQRFYYVGGKNLRRTHRVLWGRTSSGAEAIASASFSFSGYRETPRVLTARTIAPDGTVRVVNPDKIFISNEGSAQSDSRVITWAFPQVEAGTMVETIVQFEGTHFEPMDIYHFDVFTEGVPVISRKLELRTPTLWPLITRASSGVTHETRQRGDAIHNYFAATRLAKYVEEEQMPSGFEQCEWARYAYRKSWKEEAEFYWPKVADKIDTSKGLQDVAKRLLKNKKSMAERIEGLYRFVADSIRYEAISFGEGTIVPRTGSATIANGFGDCKDKTVLLLSLLKCSGIDGFPALLSTSDKSWFDPEVPDMAQFDHMIAFVPSAERPWLDPTCSVCRAGDITSELAGRAALIVGSTREHPLDSIPEPAAEDDKLFRRIRVVPQAEGGIAIDVTINFVGPTAHNLQTNLPQTQPAAVRKYLESQHGVGLSRFARLTNYSAPAQPPKGLVHEMSAQFSADSAFDKSDTYGRVHVNLFQLSNRFSLPDTLDRKLDVERGQTFSLVESITVVPGTRWELFNNPVSWNWNTAWFDASCAVRRFDDSIIITSSYVQRQSRIRRSDYAEYYRLIERLHTRLSDQSPSFRRRPDSVRLAAYKQAIITSPQDVSLLTSLAKEYLGDDLGGTGCAGNKYRKTACSLMLRAAELSPGNDLIILPLISMLFSSNQFKVADSVLHTYLGGGATEALFGSLRAAVAGSLGRFSEATALLEKTLAMSPDDRLRSVIVTLYIEANEYEKAKRQIELMESLHSDSLQLMSAKYQYATAIKDWAGALALVDQWPNRDSSVIGALRVSVLQSKGDFRTVVNDARDLLTISPENPWALNNCAWAMYKIDSSLEDALRMAELALSIKGDCDATVRNTRGAILLKLNRIGKAETDFLSCLNDESARAQSVNRYFLGKCSLVRGDTVRARNYFLESVSANGDKEHIALSRDELARLGN